MKTVIGVDWAADILMNCSIGGRLNREDRAGHHHITGLELGQAASPVKTSDFLSVK